MIALIVELIVLGVIFFFIEQIPMDPIFHTGIRVVAILIVLFIILGALGIVSPVNFTPLR